MEGQAPAAAAPAPAAAPAQSSGGSNQIIMTIVKDIITGFAIGVGFILAQKLLKKNVVVEGTSSANGQPMPMYPPRMEQRPPMPMRRPMPPNYGAGYGGGFMPFSGKPTFDINDWMKQSNVQPVRHDDILANVQD